jgi:hypothetical protein
MCSFECQQENGHINHQHTGTGTGEICEIINAKLAELHNMTKYMSPVNRDARIEHVCAEIK